MRGSATPFLKVKGEDVGSRHSSLWGTQWCGKATLCPQASWWRLWAQSPENCKPRAGIPFTLVALGTSNLPGSAPSSSLGSNHDTRRKTPHPELERPRWSDEARDFVSQLEGFTRRFPTLQGHFFLVWASTLRGPTLWGPTLCGPQKSTSKIEEIGRSRNWPKSLKRAHLQ